MVNVTDEMIEAGCIAFQKVYQDPGAVPLDYAKEVTAVIKAALAAIPQPVAIPRAWISEQGPITSNERVAKLWVEAGLDVTPLYTTPPSSLREENERLNGADAPMACGGDDDPMTAAEEVLAWLLIEKIGVPDDVTYTPNQAQEIIVRMIDRATAAEAKIAKLEEALKPFAELPDAIPSGQRFFAQLLVCPEGDEPTGDTKNYGPDIRAARAALGQEVSHG